MKKMADIAFVKPNYPHEKRVCVIPDDIDSVRNNIAYEAITIEEGFGKYLGISDDEYEKIGCKIKAREECFDCQNVFSLKLIQSTDYDNLKEGGNIIGWMHPEKSGKYFCDVIARKKGLSIFDIDSVYPRIFYSNGETLDVEDLPKHFFWENSYIAGQAACKFALEEADFKNIENKQACVLGSGSVSQGAFQYLSSIGMNPRMFYRKTFPIFYDQISSFDIIVNGIEISDDDKPILAASII